MDIDLSRIPKAEAVSSLEQAQDVIHLPISQGSVKNILDQCYRQLGGFETHIKTQLQDSAVVHFDETGKRLNKLRFLYERLMIPPPTENLRCGLQ